MAHEEHRSIAPPHLGHLSHALLPEGRVPDGQHLVDNHDRRLEMGRDREREPQAHARRVALDRGVEEALDTRELDDLVEARADLAARACPARRR